MKSKVAEEFREVISAVAYLPSVSLIMPFDPKIALRAELDHKITNAVKEIEKKLYNDYPQEKAQPVIEKLKRLTGSLNYGTYKKSIGIFVNPLVEKVYYLDIPVEEKIIIDESFEIRDLVYSRKDIHKYLVLMLSAEWAKMFIGNTTQFIRIKSSTPGNAAAYKTDMPSRVANFTDPQKQREVMLDKFLRHTDGGLSIILNTTPLPVFVIGAEKTLDHFKKISKNNSRVLAYIHGNYEQEAENEIRELLKPYTQDWKKVKQEDLLHQVNNAAGGGLLAYGINDVWHAAASKNIKLLITEKNFIYPAQLNPAEGISQAEHYTSNSLYIKDAVDDIIARVFENGGDVEFVEDDMLNDYGHIAAIKYYHGITQPDETHVFK